jgi:putative phosphoesterase
MRIAVVSDIHGNLAAFEAVLADLRETAPDLIFHGGDLAHGGSSPSEIIYRIRDLGWPGVLGNTDEILFRPESLTEFGLPKPLSEAIAEMAAWTRETVGAARLEWLRSLPIQQIHAPLALVHASPSDTWRSPTLEATDEDLKKVYSPLGQPVAVYAHIHRSFVRALPGLTVINTGSVNLSYDGDPRSAYLLLDDSKPSIRRVDYDIEIEARTLSVCGVPHADWIVRMLRSARPEMP